MPEEGTLEPARFIRAPDGNRARDTNRTMLSLTSGETALILFIFALTWGAGWLPRVGERLGERSATRGRE